MYPTEKERLTKALFDTDKAFDQLYPNEIQLMAKQHWTPLAVARKAARFLATKKGVRVLDIGSGVGKFCIAAAYYQPNAFYWGIEQRKNLVDCANAALEATELTNTAFIEGNFTQLDFKNYDHFYFYNAFYENLTGTNKIDDNIDYSAELYNYYSRYLYRQLQLKPAGTRLAAFHSLEDEMPASYHLVGTDMDNLLKFWIKV